MEEPYICNRPIKPRLLAAWAFVLAVKSESRMSKLETNPNPESRKGTGRRTTLEEVGVYTAKDDKIAR